MKNILRQIADIIYNVEDMDRETMMGILNPLETMEQATNFLNYIKENINNSSIMRTDKLLRKAVEIGN